MHSVSPEDEPYEMHKSYGTKNSPLPFRMKNVTNMAGFLRLFGTYLIVGL